MRWPVIATSIARVRAGIAPLAGAVQQVRGVAALGRGDRADRERRRDRGALRVQEGGPHRDGVAVVLAAVTAEQAGQAGGRGAGVDGARRVRDADPLHPAGSGAAPPAKKAAPAPSLAPAGALGKNGSPKAPVS